MSSIEERVAYLEGQVSEQSHLLVEVRTAIRQLQETVAQLKTDSVTRTEFREAITRLDDKMDRQFTWLVGIQVTTLATIVAALVGALVTLTPR